MVLYSTDATPGDLVVVELRDAVITGLRAAFPLTFVREVVKSRGPVTSEIISDVAVNAPAIVVACQAVASDVVVTSTKIRIPVVMSVASVTEPVDGPKDDASIVIMTRIIRRATGYDWGLAGVDTPEQISAKNIYDKDIGANGVNVWITFCRQEVSVPHLAEDEIDDLENLTVVWTKWTAGEAPQPELDVDGNPITTPRTDPEPSTVASEWDEWDGSNPDGTDPPLPEPEP